jgi:hypothetical protein
MLGVDLGILALVLGTLWFSTLPDRVSLRDTKSPMTVGLLVLIGIIVVTIVRIPYRGVAISRRTVVAPTEWSNVVEVTVSVWNPGSEPVSVVGCRHGCGATVLTRLPVFIAARTCEPITLLAKFSEPDGFRELRTQIYVASVSSLSRKSVTVDVVANPPILGPKGEVR